MHEYLSCNHSLRGSVYRDILASGSHISHRENSSHWARMMRESQNYIPSLVVRKMISSNTPVYILFPPIHTMYFFRLDFWLSFHPV